METADPWLPPPAFLTHQLARRSSSPSVRALMPELFLLLGSPAFICQRMLRDTRWQAAEALNHFRSKCPLSPFPLSFLFCDHPFLALFFSPAHLPLPQTSACRHTHCARNALYSASLSCTHTHSCIAMGSCAKVCVCVEALALESSSRSLKHCL